MSGHYRLEGWGGTALKNHYIVGDRAICGRTPLSFEPTIYECFSESDRALHPEQYCKLCSRMVDAAVAAGTAGEGPEHDR